MAKKTMVLIAVFAAVLVLGVGAAFGMNRMDRGAMHRGGMMGGGQMMNGSAMTTGGHTMQGWQSAGSTPSPIAGAREVTITAKDLSFTPAEVSVKPGEAINIAFHNADEMVHDFTIPSLGVHVVAQPGATVTFGVAVASPGSYEFFCTVPGHAAAGMHGTITAAS